MLTEYLDESVNWSADEFVFYYAKEMKNRKNKSMLPNSRSIKSTNKVTPL